jgi:hypothetical protein
MDKFNNDPLPHIEEKEDPLKVSDQIKLTLLGSLTAT